MFFFWSDPIFSFFNMKAIDYPGVMQLAVALVFVFGIGYYWVSKDISVNHDRLGGTDGKSSGRAFMKNGL